MNNKFKLDKKFTEIDLYLHRYMYDFADFGTARDFFQYVFNDTDGLLDDFDPIDVREAFVRQYTGWVGYWTDEVETSYNQVSTRQH